MTKRTLFLLAISLSLAGTAQAQCGAQDKGCLQKSALEAARQINAVQAAGGGSDAAASAVSPEAAKDFANLVILLSAENQAEGEAEAAAAGVSFDDYITKRDTLVWRNFKGKVDAAQARLDSSSPEEVFAEQLKLQLRFKAQQQRFVADNQFEVEGVFRDYNDAALAKLGFKKPAGF